MLATSTEVPDLLDQIEADVGSTTADGAYDGEAVYEAVAERHPSATVIIPSRVTSVADETEATQRDRHLAMIDEHGRMAGSVANFRVAAAWRRIGWGGFGGIANDDRVQGQPL